MALKYADRLESNNPKAYGIVKGTEVSGFKVVQSLEKLYTIPDCILSGSGENTNSDAIGQEWFVSDSGKYYRLVSWDSRNTESGWEEVVSMSAGEKTKLGGIEDNAQANKIEGISIDGTDIGIVSKKVDIPLATTNNPGVLAAEDKLRIDSLTSLVTILDYHTVFGSFIVTDENYDLIKEAIARKDLIIVKFGAFSDVTVISTSTNPMTGDLLLFLAPRPNGVGETKDTIRQCIIVDANRNVEVRLLDIGLLPADLDTLGGVKVGYPESDQNYALQVDSEGRGFVSVPWDVNYPTMVNGSSTSAVVNLQPNRYYQWSTPLTSLDVKAANPPASVAIVYEYVFQFTCPSDVVTNFTYPNTWKWMNPVFLEPGKTYIVSVINNLAVIGGA